MTERARLSEKRRDRELTGWRCWHNCRENSQIEYSSFGQDEFKGIVKIQKMCQLEALLGSFIIVHSPFSLVNSMLGEKDLLF